MAQLNDCPLIEQAPPTEYVPEGVSGVASKMRFEASVPLMIRLPAPPVSSVTSMANVTASPGATVAGDAGVCATMNAVGGVVHATAGADPAANAVSASVSPAASHPSLRDRCLRCGML